MYFRLFSHRPEQIHVSSLLISRTRLLQRGALRTPPPRYQYVVFSSSGGDGQRAWALPPRLHSHEINVTLGRRAKWHNKVSGRDMCQKGISHGFNNMLYMSALSTFIEVDSQGRPLTPIPLFYFIFFPAPYVTAPPPGLPQRTSPLINFPPPLPRPGCNELCTLERHSFLRFHQSTCTGHEQLPVR